MCNKLWLKKKTYFRLGCFYYLSCIWKAKSKTPEFTESLTLKIGYKILNKEDDDIYFFFFKYDLTLPEQLTKTGQTFRDWFFNIEIMQKKYTLHDYGIYVKLVFYISGSNLTLFCCAVHTAVQTVAAFTVWSFLDWNSQWKFCQMHHKDIFSSVN